MKSSFNTKFNICLITKKRKIPLIHQSTLRRTTDNTVGVISSIQVKRRLPKLDRRRGGRGWWLLARFRVVVPIIVPKIVLLILLWGGCRAIGLFLLPPRNVPGWLFVIRARRQLWRWDWRWTSYTSNFLKFAKFIWLINTFNWSNKYILINLSNLKSLDCLYSFKI